jgi:hypothetical protein
MSLNSDTDRTQRLAKKVAKWKHVCELLDAIDTGRQSMIKSWTFANFEFLSLLWAL